MRQRGTSNRILNTSRNCHLKRTQAIARVAAKTAVWVVVGESIRELSMAEVLALRAAQKASGQVSPYRGMANELPGIIWEPPASDRFAIRLRYPLLKQAAEILSGTCR